MFYNNRNPEEENQGGVTLATSSGTASPMQPANFKVGPLADHRQQPSAAQQAATNIGSNVAGKVVDGALFGGETGAALGMGETGLISKGMSGLTGMFGGAAPYAATGQTAMGMAPGQLLAMGANPAAAGSVAAGAGAGAASAGLAAAAPIAIPALIGAKMFGLFNKGGSVGPLSAQYKEGGGEAKPMYAGEGAYTFPSVNWLPGYGGSLAMLEDERMEDRLYDADRPISRWEELGYHKMFPSYKGIYWNKGGDVQHKEHGGMTGPLSNNKSVKMEKKETIEYKN